MGSNEDIRRAIRSLAGTEDAIRLSYVCTVTAVDWTARTCEVTHESGISFAQVRLRSVADGATVGICCKPTIGSYVVIECVEGADADYYVGVYSQIDEVAIEIGATKMNITDGLVCFNDGKNIGIVNIRPLKDNLDAIKKQLTALQSATAAGLSAIGVGLSANGATGAVAFNSAMAGKQIQFKDMEDKSITH